MVLHAVGVLGLIAPGDLGFVLPHEHLTIDNGFNVQPRPGIDPGEHVSTSTIASSRIWTRARRDNLVLDRIDLVEEALDLYRKAGGRSLVEMTTVGNGRGLNQMAAIAKTTGVNVIATTGLYVDASHPQLPEDISATELADHFIWELLEPEVRCGAIGEVGLSRVPTDREWRALDAALIAAAQTNAPVWIHITTLQPLPQLLVWMQRRDGPADRIVICHMDHDLRDLSLHRQALKAGFNVEFDQFGYPAWTGGPFAHAPTDTQRLNSVLQLASEGFARQLLLSHDVCQKIQLPQFGGFGYSHLLENVQPLFIELGGTNELFDQLTRENPGRLLCWADQ